MPQAGISDEVIGFFNLPIVQTALWLWDWLSL
jgi:hypothetical protein